MIGDALLRRPECLFESEKIAIKADRGLDVANMEIDLRTAEHRVLVRANPHDGAPAAQGPYRGWPGSGSIKIGNPLIRRSSL